MSNDFDSPDPYGSDPDDSSKPTDSLPFSTAVFRGVGAANRTLLGAFVMLVLIGPIQVMVAVSGALMLQGNVFQPPEPGQPPSPEMYLILGLGCFTCCWLPVVVFGLPWAVGGIYGQLCDRIARRTARSYVDCAKRFYTRLLLLVIIFMAIVMLMCVPLWILGAVLNSAQPAGGEFDVEQLREANRHPVNIAVGVAFSLVLTTLSVIFTLIQAALVSKDCQIGEATSRAFRFVREHPGDTFKLLVIFILTSIPLIVLQQAGNFVPTVTVIMLALGIVTTLYTCYLSVLNAGIGVSAYLNHQSAKELA